METSSRFRLEPVEPRHRPDLLALLRDPATWAHVAGSPADAEAKTETILQTARRSREECGLGSWAVFEGEQFLGCGGAWLLPVGVWNVGFRFGSAHWGRGVATEVARAAVAAATRTAPQLPVTGRTALTNEASARVLARTGLSVVWQGEGVTGPARVHADRPVDESALTWLVAHT